MSMFARSNFLPVNLSDKPSFFVPPLRGGVVHVWTAELGAWSEIQLSTLANYLDAEEQARAQRFHFERDRRHFVAARGFLRRLLGAYLEAPPGEVCFCYGSRGKPSVSSPATALHFNLSHSHGRAVFVFALDREVGIDVEAGTRLGEDWPGLVRRVFSSREQAEIFSLAPAIRRTAFLNGWTRKEAYLKATGLGIVDGLQSIEVTLDPLRPAALLAAPAGMDWELHDLRTDAQYAAALIVGGFGAVEIQRFTAPIDW